MVEMRGLIWPTYSNPGNVATDSLYIIARNMVRVAPEVHWYLIVPAWEGKVPIDEIDEMPWVTKVPVPMHTLYRTQESIVDADAVWRFAPQQGVRPVEFVVSMSPQRTMNLANAWSIRLHEDYRPVMVNYDLLARDDRKKEYDADELELIHCAAGFWAGDLNVHESSICEFITKYNARRWLAPAQVRRIMDRSEVIEQGVPVGMLDQTIDGVKKRDKFTVYYGGRFSNSKRFDALTEILDRMYSFGRDMEYVVCTGSLSTIQEAKFRKKFPQVELHVGTNQYEAWKLMAECHASICLSRGELFGLSFWEQIAAGLAVVMKTERWNEEMLPGEYPLWATSGQEVAARMRLLFDQFQEGDVGPDGALDGWGVGGEWAKYVRSRYDADVNLRVMTDRIKEQVMVRRGKLFATWEADTATGSSLAEVASEVLVEGMAFSEYVRAMKRASRIGSNFVGARLSWGKSMSTLDAYRMAVFLGWTDVGGEEPVWSRS